MRRDDLSAFLTSYLKSDDYNDDCPNGLQVEGTAEIKKIFTAVSASVELFEAAITQKADTVIVHHGIIWNFERPLYRGGYRERIRLLLENNINLYGFHLPLDAHEEIGNNAQLCRKLEVKNMRPFGDIKGQYIGMKGEIEKVDKNVFFKRISNLVDRDPLIFDYGPDQVETVGIISGGAQKYFNQAVSSGLDVYLTGEVSEHIMHYAKEEKIHFVSAGHYATEKFGIIALGQLLEKQFDADVTFIDINNPV
jgi:dinuclear metal center YbgI/SA1388 family protein